jgi:L-idonate 5-dehydrogenase
MRVCVLHAARDLRIEERPALPLGPDQVRVRFGAGGICGSDLHYYFEGGSATLRCASP